MFFLTWSVPFLDSREYSLLFFSFDTVSFAVSSFKNKGYANSKGAMILCQIMYSLFVDPHKASELHLFG